MADELPVEAEGIKKPDELLADLLHAMHNPLLYIVGYSEVLLETMESLTDDQRRFVETIRENAIRLRDLRQHHLDRLKNFIGPPTSESKPIED